MLRVVHWLFGGVAVLSAMLFVTFALAALGLINPNLKSPQQMAAISFPWSSRRSDYVGRGWQYRKAQWVCLAICLLATIVWGATDRYH